MRRWFHRDHYIPREIERDHPWQRLSEGGKRVYRDLCENSYLVTRSSTRRYCYWTYKQIAERCGLSTRHVRRIVKELMRTRLVLRHYKGDSGTTLDRGRPRAPRYELPASRGMIIYWRHYRGKG